jgi:uncharacterized protein (TIGR02996 family)
MNDALLAEVLAQPDDDAPRLILADWLTERGDPRGELIAVQCALARPQIREKAQELQKRELDLLREHGAAWVTDHGLDPVRVTATRRHDAVERARGATLMFHRGFADELKTTAADFVPASDTLTRTPLRRLVLTDATSDQVLAVARANPIATLTTLRLRDCSLPAPALAGLAGSALAAPAAELAFHRCELEDLGALAGAPLPALRNLELDECRAGHLDRLAAAPWLPTLHAFRLIETYAPDQLRQLLTSRRWRALAVLHLRVRLPDGDIAVIASSQIAYKLVELEIPHYYVGPATVEAFTRSTRLGRLQRLILRGYGDAADLGTLHKRWGPKLILER